MDVEAIWLSLQLAALTTAVLLLAGLPLAYWLAVTRWRLKFLLEAIVVLPMILPPTVLGYYLFTALGPTSRHARPGSPSRCWSITSRRWRPSATSSWAGSR